MAPAALSMRIRYQFLLILSGASLVILLVSLLAAQISFQRSLDRYLGERQEARLQSLSLEFADYYASYGNFDDIGLRTLVWEAERGNGERLPPDLVLMDEERFPIFGPPLPPDALALEPIVVDGSTVGWLGLPNSEQYRQDIEQRFSQRQQRLLWGIAIACLVLALVGAWWLSRALVRPVEALAALSTRLTHGDYHARLAIQRAGEVGELIDNMNRLADALEKNRTSRQRWLADLSHELRTPVTVLRGELEAVQDGVRPLDSARVNSLHNEILHLGKLLDDLHDLALADAGALRYRVEDINLSALVRSSTEAFQPLLAQKNQALSLQLPDTDLHVAGDAVRLRQLLDNLLNNSHKYTHGDGQVRVSLSGDTQQVTLVVEDSAPGVGDDQLPRIFDYLYRVDSSRNRASGGAGLGLAICQRIAEGHGGHLQAAPSSLGGLRITLTLPRTAPARSTS